VRTGRDIARCRPDLRAGCLFAEGLVARGLVAGLARQLRAVLIAGDQRHRGARQIRMAWPGIGRSGTERAEPLEDRAIGRTVARHALQARLDQAGEFRW